jgi:aspartate aminotransferase
MFFSIISKNIFVISDEIYEKIIYDNLKHVSIASLDKDIFNLTITVNGVSKAYSMTGWRIGYLAAPQEIADAISRLQDHSTSNPTSIAQKGAGGNQEAGTNIPFLPLPKLMVGMV